jgi:hypothetical protein
VTSQATRPSLGARIQTLVPRRFDRHRHAPALVLGLGLLSTLLLSLYWVRDGFVGVDALHYISRRGGLPSEDLGLLEPYAGHWQPIPILLYRSIFAVFGIEPYWPYALMGILLHLVVCTLTYLILVRCGISRWVAVATTWALLFFGAGSEAWLSDAPMALTSSLAFGLGATYLCLGDDLARRRTLAATLLLLGIMCSATGAVAIVLVACFCLAARGPWTALRVAGPAFAIFVLWFLFFGRTGGRVANDAAAYLSVPEFVWTGLTAPIGNALGTPAAGAALTLGVVAAAFVLPVTRPALRHLALAGILAAAAQMTLSSSANLIIGPSAMNVGRYQYVALVLFAPAVALVLQALVTYAGTRQRGPGRALPVLVAFAVLAAVTVQGLREEREQSFFLNAQSIFFRDSLYGVAAAAAEGERLLTESTGIAIATGADFELFAQPELRSGLSDWPVDDLTKLQAEGEFFVGVSPESLVLGAPTALRSTSFHETPRLGAGCVDYMANTYSPVLVMDTGLGAQILVTSESGAVTSVLQRDDLVSNSRRWGLVPGQPTFIGSTAIGASLTLAFDAGGQYTICMG